MFSVYLNIFELEECFKAIDLNVDTNAIRSNFLIFPENFLNLVSISTLFIVNNLKDDKMKTWNELSSIYNLMTEMFYQK